MMNDIVGHKNPAIASPFSIRGQLLSGWEHYGLQKPPDELDNCLYVSKSSFFAIKDRVLWVSGSTLYTDHFAKRLIAEGINLSTIQNWMLNPESDATGKGNILELTRGQGTNECLLTLIQLAKHDQSAKMKIDSGNADARPISPSKIIPIISKTDPVIESALVILKPNISQVPAAVDLVREKLSDYNIKICSEGVNHSLEIFTKFESHYKDISKWSNIVNIADIKLDEEMDAKFNKTFNATWQDVNEMEIVFCYSKAAEHMKIDNKTFYNEYWKHSNYHVKLAPGLYVSRIQLPKPPLTEEELAELEKERKREALKKRRVASTTHLDKLISFDEYTRIINIKPRPEVIEFIYVVNGFYGYMMELYNAGPTFRYMVVEWDATQMSYADVHCDVIGDRDPTKVKSQTIRGDILENWRKLGLASEPDVLENSVSMSKSAFAGMIDRLLWVKGSILYTDHFAKRLIDKKIKIGRIKSWLSDCHRLKNDLEYMNSDECTDILLNISEDT